MKNAIQSQDQFDRSLKQLSDLYEEGKDCLHSLSILNEEHEHYYRVFDIIRELRDIAAVNLKASHENKIAKTPKYEKRR